jgi:hypothetical protein
MMGKHRDRRTGELREPLSEHATFRLGIDYGFRPAFTEGGPMPRDTYERYRNTPQGAYFVAPPHEEYLRMYDMYLRTCKLRDMGLDECEAAEAVRKRRLFDINPLDEASFEKLRVHRDLQGAFTQGRLLSRDEYELIYVFDPMLPKGVAPYDEYSRNCYYGEMGVGPMSREEYMKQYCMVAPPYEEYQQLYKKYSE